MSAAFFASLPNPDNHKACQDVLDQLKSCGCCKDHDKNKPSKYSPWIETKDNSDQMATKPCDCICRHKARHICRRHPGLFLHTNNTDDDGGSNSLVMQRRAAAAASGDLALARMVLDDDDGLFKIPAISDLYGDAD